MRGILNCTLEHTPYAKQHRKAPEAQKDDLEEEMSLSLGQALEATVCMVNCLFHILWTVAALCPKLALEMSHLNCFFPS